MKSFIYIFTLFALLCSSCDDGLIYPKEDEEETGRKATFSARFEGLDAWPQAYLMVFAGFGEDQKIPVISKVITQPEKTTELVTVTINGLPEEVKTLSVSVMSKGRALIHSFYSQDVQSGTEDIILPEQQINMAEYPRIQEQVFNLYCVRCHGAGSYAAAGLHLTDDKSHISMVNQEAVLSTDGKLLVKPGDVSGSFIHDILTSDIINYNHTDVLPENELITLIDTWIKSGAKNE